MTRKPKWIMYLSQNTPDNITSEVTPVMSTDDAVRAFKEFCDAVGTEECTGRLYPWTVEDWQSALEFRDVGCPFDYPSYVVERGTRGGVRVERT